MSELFSVTETLRGKRILFTGATGFVGKVALSMLLTRFPEVGKVFVLARPGVSTSAADRFYGKVVVAPPFDPLRAALGGDFDAFFQEKCEPVGGDLAKPFCGFPEELLERLTGEVDLLINSAGLIDFNPTLESAIKANATGAVNVARTAKRLGAKLVHVSTCFVAGNAPGIVPEDEELVGYFPKRDEWPTERFDPFQEIEDCQKTIERLKGQADDKALLSAFRAKAISRLHDEGRDEHDEKAVRTGALRERKLWLTERQISAGLDRSKHWGWPNTYCYTKSLGDQVIAKIAADEGLEFAIVRPAIVESSLRFPFPGWNEGFTTTAPLTFLGLKGHRAYPAKHGLILDVIPCDHVAAGMLAVGAGLLAGRARKVYQLGTSDSNPLRCERTIEMTGLYRRTHYLKKAQTGDRLMNELLARIEPQTVTAHGYKTRSAPQLVSLAKGAKQLLEELKPSWGAPRIGSAIERVQGELDELARRAGLADQMFELFLPFIWDNSYIFESKNIRALYAQMEPRDAARIPWDPEGFDWLDYWVGVHMEGLARWVYPSLEDELGGKVKKRGVPVYRDLWEMIEARARRHAGKVAMRFLRADGGADRYTYGQLRDRAVRAAFYLEASGVEPADRVLILSENRPEWAMAYFGTLKAAATAVPVDREASLAEVENLARSSKARVVVLSAKVRSRLGLDKAKEVGGASLLALDDLFTARAPHSIDGQLAPRDPIELASLIFTSGTTGKPKGVMLSGRNFTSLVAKLADVFALGERDGLLSVLPLHHTFEFTAGLLVPLACGAEITYLEEVSGDSIQEAFGSGRITAMVGVPALWQLLLRRIEGQLADAGLAKPAKLLQGVSRELSDKAGLTRAGKALFFPVHQKFGGRLRFLISGGSAMPPDVYEAFRGMGFSIFEGYGLTEAAPVLTVQEPGDAQAGHVGKPLSGIEVKIHEPDADGVGEVIAKGPNVMLGYFEDPEATAQVLRDGWLYTGDLGKLDEDRHLSIVGRSKDVIVASNGKNLYPDELEELYGVSPFIKELSIVGLPDDGGGEKIGCLVVPDYAKGAREEVRREVEGHLREVALTQPVYKRPKVTQLQDHELPRTATRKVKRKQVIDELLRRERQQKVAAGKRPSASDGDAWLYELLARVCEQPRENLRPTTNLENDLGFDSLMFTELSAALEETGLRLPSPDALLSIATIGELARHVAEWRRGGRTSARIESDASKTPEPGRAHKRSRLDGLFDVVQPAIDKVPAVASAVALVRSELEQRPARAWPKTRQDQRPEPASIALPDAVIRSGRAVLRAGQIGLYEKFLSTKVHGRAYVPQGENFLVAANHVSHLDMGLIKHALGDQGEKLVALAARDYFFSDRMRRTYFENFTNLIPMDRHGSLRESLKLASRSLRQGKNLLIFPEGTRATDGQLKEFKGSLGYLALTNRVGIVPIYLAGTYEALPKGKVIPRGRDVAAHVGPYLSYEELVARTKGLPRSEQHREVARIVEEAVRALAERRRPAPAPKPARETQSRAAKATPHPVVAPSRRRATGRRKLAADPGPARSTTDRGDE